MNRRRFLGSALMGSATLALTGFSYRYSGMATSKMKIVKIRYYNAPGYTKPVINQARGIVEIETNTGLIGIGEGGGSRDLIEQCAFFLIGEDPFRIDYLWQKVYRGDFYPPGREKLDAMGALDMALWDLKGKALDVPVYDLLGGASREYVECYSTGFRASSATTDEQRAKDCIAAGFRSYRIQAGGGGANGGGVPATAGTVGMPNARGGNTRFDYYAGMRNTIDHCQRISEAVGRNGNWAIDIHCEFDPPDAIRICNEIADMEPYFVEDLIRSENPGVYKMLRQQVKVPIAVGEQFGDRWDINELIENHLIDYARVTLPNTGGITEFMKISAICETHYVGMIPHFTGPLATATLVHALGASPVRALMELSGGVPEKPAYFNSDFINFKEGKLFLNDKPGLGVTFDPKKAEFVTEITKARTDLNILIRPDGSINNW